MSKSLALVTGSRAAAVDAASKVLTALGVSVTKKDVGAVGSADGKVFIAGPLTKDEVATLGRGLGAPLSSTTTSLAFSAALNPDKTYSDAGFTLVRANVPDPEDVAIPYKERINKFTRAGLTVDKEKAYIAKLAAEVATKAVALAEAHKTRITFLKKPQTAYAQINDLYHDALKKVASEAVSDDNPKGVGLEVAHTTQVANQAIMFSSTLGVIVAPDYSAADTFEMLSVGLGGGAGLVAQVHSGGGNSVYAQAYAEAPAGHDPAANPTGLLIAAAGALRENGAAAEAGKLEAALKKVYSAGGAPEGVHGGKASASAFAEAVAKAL